MEDIQKIVKEISKEKCASCIFLFGSQANGKARDDSDIDIAVLTKNCSEQDIARIRGYSSDIVDISIFSKLPLIIQFRVLKEGQILFCRDEKHLYDTKVYVFKRYLDFSGFINRFYKRVIENV